MGAPDAAFAALFAEQLDVGPVPVLADPAKAIAAATGRDPKAIPGKCALSPQMEILGCYGGADDTEGFDLIVAHVQQNGG
jgi:hypothetical protein